MKLNRPIDILDLLAASAGLSWGFYCAGAFFDLFQIPAAGKLGLLLAWGLPLAALALATARRWLWPSARLLERRKTTWFAAGALLASASLLLLGGLNMDAPLSAVNLSLTILLTLSKWFGLAAFLFIAAVKFPFIALVFAWPFIFLFPYVFSVAGRFVAIGNDFTPFYYVYKVYLLDCLTSGRLPLWSPSESAGYPFYSSPLAQTFYPFNLPLTWLYRLNGGYTLQDHQIFTVFGIAIFSLGLYLWLRRLGLSQRAVLAGTMVLAVSFKITEIIRFPNAIHTAAWYPWILLALTGILLAKTWRIRIGYSLLLVFSGICLVTGGYPYFTYYIVFLAIPYLAIFIAPRLKRAILGRQMVAWKNGLIALAASGLAAGVICLPWLLDVTRLMQETSKRAGGNLEHALSYGFSWQDTVATIFFPPAAMPEGWFYFGTLAGLLVWIFLISQPFRTEENSKRMGVLRLFLGLWVIAISLLSYGDQTAVFGLLYERLPFFNQLRAWSRLNIILVPIFAWVTAAAWQAGETWLADASDQSKKMVLKFFLAACGFTLMVQLVYLALGRVHLYWEIFFVPRVSYLITSFFAQFGKEVLYPDTTLSMAFRLGFIIFGLLSGLLVWLVLRRPRRVTASFLNCLLAGFILFSAADLAFAGPWLWTNGVVPVEDRRALNVERQNLMSFSNPRKDEFTTLTLSQSFNAGSDARWHFDRYKEFRAATTDEGLENRLLGITDGQKLYFTGDANPFTVKMFLQEAEWFLGTMDVVDYNGDTLVVDVYTPADGYLHFIDNWAEGWIARLDGQPVELQRLFGVFKSVQVPAGMHTVEMIYCPAVFEVFNPTCGNP
ncbi:MAG: hypothetical protein AB9891_02830 [Anaerolineaceae bacterium]